MKATWGPQYKDSKGVLRFAVTVAFTAKSAKTLTAWTVKSLNRGGTTAGVLSGGGTYDYANGTTWRTVDAVDPTGAGSSVRVRLGMPSGIHFIQRESRIAGHKSRQANGVGKSD